MALGLVGMALAINPCDHRDHLRDQFGRARHR